MEEAKILCVDDEQGVLDGLRRNLRRTFDISTALGPEEGLAALEAEPFAVVISDYQMPGMSGAEFLAQVRERWPDVTRMLLTGNADLDAAIDTVNEGQIYRFLLKPCPKEKLIPAIEDGLERYRLVSSERVLLQETLHGAIRFLSEALALASPETFGRCRAVGEKARAVAEAVGVEAPWKVEMATLLAQVTLVTLPGDTLAKLRDGSTLSTEENAMIAKLPAVGAELLSSLPRIEDVCAFVEQQGPPWGTAGDPPADQPVESAILRACLDLDLLTSQDVPFGAAMTSLRERSGFYPPAVLDALEGTLETGAESIEEVSIFELREGMTLLEPVQTVDGRLLITEGSQLTETTVARIRNFLSNTELKDPIRVSL